MNKVKGYTTIELMTVLLIAAIMVSFAITPIRGLMLRMQLADQASLLQLDFSYARSEAINRSYPITMLPNESWTDGWIIFEDKNGDGVLNDNELQLRESEYLDTKINLADTGEQEPLIFSRFGSLQNPVQRMLSLTHTDSDLTKMVVIAAAGSISIRSLDGGGNG